MMNTIAGLRVIYIRWSSNLGRIKKGEENIWRGRIFPDSLSDYNLVDMEYKGDTPFQVARKMNKALGKVENKEYLVFEADRKSRVELDKLFIIRTRERSHCLICGVSGLNERLEWHSAAHPGGRKNFRVPRMGSIKKSIYAIKQEMEACSIVCHRCHVQYENRTEHMMHHTKNWKTHLQSTGICLLCKTKTTRIIKRLCQYAGNWMINMALLQR